MYIIKRKISVIILFLLGLSAVAQVKHPEPLIKLVNGTLMYQVLNDFNRTIPLVLYAPGFFFIGSSQYTNNPLFSESDYYDNEELVRTSDYYQKEVFDVLSSALIPYIPADSILQVRVIEGNTLLFELKFIRKADTVVFMQSDAERNKNKTVSIAGEKIISVSFYDADREIKYNSRLTGDTLRISEIIDDKTGKNTKTRMHYKNGFLTRMSFYNSLAGKYELKSTDLYFQNELNLPGLKQTLNRKGNITDSTHYYYDGDKLIHFQNFSGKDEKLSITYSYNRTGKLSAKTVKSVVRNYTNDYSYANGYIADLEIDDKAKASKRHYVFTMDVSKKLIGIEYNTISKESFIEHLKTRWLLGYNEKGNVSSIKVMDDKGLISKEIKFEYNFFEPGNQ